MWTPFTRGRPARDGEGGEEARRGLVRSALALAKYGGLVAGAALLGATFTRQGRDTTWYRELRTPWFQPPDAAFAPVWTLLFALIAASGYRVWRAPPSPTRTRALRLWRAQLALNVAWSYLFFGRRSPRAALADSTLLVVTIASYMRAARRADGLAALLFAPYLGWVGFATVLNADIVRKNPPA